MFLFYLWTLFLAPGILEREVLLKLEVGKAGG
jgi:hypothetical protein